MKRLPVVSVVAAALLSLSLVGCKKSPAASDDKEAAARASGDHKDESESH